MENRENELSQLNLYIQGIDKDLTMILQSLQWDRNELMEGNKMVTCKYDTNHRIPLNIQGDHETTCIRKSQGYAENDIFLPDPLDVNANTVVKLSKDDIFKIIENTSHSDPLFRKGVGSHETEPLTLARLQTTYTADERRAVHDAVMSAVPACHDLADLALLCSNGHEAKDAKSKTRMEILAELRDMRRRRTKYRVAAKSRNYSDVLRDVIKTQMEFYDVQSDANSSWSSKQNTEVNTNTDNRESNQRTNEKQIDYKYDSKRSDNIRMHSKERQERTNRRIEHKDVKSESVDRYRSSRTRDRSYDANDRRDNSLIESSGGRDRHGKHRDDRDHAQKSYYENIRDNCRGSSKYENSHKRSDKETFGDTRSDYKRDDKSKYDKYYRRSKRGHEERSNDYRESRNKEERYKRYYDVTQDDYDSRRKKSKE